MILVSWDETNSTVQQHADFVGQDPSENANQVVMGTTNESMMDNDVGILSTPPPTTSRKRPPPSCKSSLKVQWPPQRSRSMSLDKSQTATTSLKDLSLVTDSMTNLFDSSYHNEIGDGLMILARLRAKMDCPVTAGVVERCLSQLKLTQFTGSLKGRMGDLVDEKERIDDHVYLCGRTNNVFPRLSPPMMGSPANVSPKRPTQQGNLQRVQRQRSTKLQQKWPPVRDTQKNQRIVDQRRNETSREIERAISGRSSGSIQEKRSFYENTSSSFIFLCRSNSRDDASTCDTETTVESLTPTRSPLRKVQQTLLVSPRNILPPRIENLVVEGNDANLHGDEEGAEPRTDTASVATEDKAEVVFFDIVLPSGQRLPPPQGRSKHRRLTNYRIRYQGPTLLRLEDVYGNLMEIPEVDNRFCTGRCDEGPLTKPMRHDSGLPPSPPKLSYVGGVDAAPTYPKRQSYDDDTSELDRDECFKEEEILKDDHCDDSLSDDDLFCRHRPDVWIAPLKSVDGDRKWKVKRVWDVDDIDDTEPEYEVDQLDLMSSIRDLLGVPDDLGATFSEREVDIDESNPWDTSAAKDVPPSLPRKSIFTLETVYDVDGLHDGAERCVEMTASNFESKIKSIIETTVHDVAMEKVQYKHSKPTEPKQRAFNRPDECVLPQDSRATFGRRSWKVKASQKVEEQVNASGRNATDPLILEESSNRERC